MGTIFSYATLGGSRYNISRESMLRLFTSLGLDQKAANTLFLDVNLELPGLDIFEWSEQRIPKAEEEWLISRKNDLKVIEDWILRTLKKIGKTITSSQLGSYWQQDDMSVKFDGKKLSEALKERKTNIPLFLRELHEEEKLVLEIIPTESGGVMTRIQMKKDSDV